MDGQISLGGQEPGGEGRRGEGRIEGRGGGEGGETIPHT